MALFGLFGKKDGQSASEEKDSPRTRQRGDTVPHNESHKNDSASRQSQRNVARAATAKKIDAIESEMSSEFAPPTQPGKPVAPAAAARSQSAGKAQASDTALPSMGVSTEMLLGEEGRLSAIEIANSGADQVIEEAAILFANGQTDLVEQLLLTAITDEAIADGAGTAWWMLFDLYQITGKRQQFDNLSIDYASKFESSPPSWTEANQAGAQPAPAKTGATPTVAFSGKLDANIVKLLERAQKLGQNSPVLRLEFVRVTEVDPIGCGLLLRILKKLQSSEHELILVGAHELAAKIRAILQVGRRNETEAPWLLLLEILRLLNSEKEFEETSIDYCITFEVSPPAFVPPKNKVTTAMDEIGPANAASDSFTMPTVIEGKTEQLIAAIAAFAAEHNPAILDCSRLNRIDFSAAGHLMTGLAPICGGKAMELHNVNHLVAALFKVLGISDMMRVLPRKL